MWKPSNPYETFCQIAAGCTQDDHFDHFCSYAVGKATYEDYYKIWERPRDVPVHD